jgi:hypothetical protein
MKVITMIVYIRVLAFILKIAAYLSFLVLGLLILITSIISFTNLSVFKSSLLAVFLETVFVFFIMNGVNRNLSTLKPRILKCIALGEFLFIFTIFGPVFLDRSISYHMVMASYDKNGITAIEVARNHDDIMQKRLVELTNLGLLKLEGDLYYPTAAGIFFTKTNKIIENISGIKEEYNKFLVGFE